MDPNIHGILKTRRGSRRSLRAKVRRIAKKFDGNTQRVRGHLILDLKALQELCNDRAINTHPKKWKEKQNWARLAAYISQVINSISHEYDANKIKETLEQLEKKVAKLQQLQRKHAKV